MPIASWDTLHTIKIGDSSPYVDYRVGFHAVIFNSWRNALYNWQGLAGLWSLEWSITSPWVLIDLIEKNAHFSNKWATLTAFMNWRGLVEDITLHLLLNSRGGRVKIITHSRQQTTKIWVWVPLRDLRSKSFSRFWSPCWCLPLLDVSVLSILDPRYLKSLTCFKVIAATKHIE